MDYQLNGTALRRERAQTQTKRARPVPAADGAPRNLVDTFQRRVSYLRVSITDRCNLRCTYCMPEEGIDWMEWENILRYEEILRILHLMSRRGLKKVRVTGGEPLARKGVVEFVGQIAQIPGLNEIALTTNATKLDELAQPLYDTGLRHVNISLDTLDRDRMRAMTRRDCYDKVMAGLHAAEAVGFNPIKLNMVLQKGVNDDEVVAFARLTLEKPYHVRFIEYMPASGDWEDWRAKYMPASVIQERIRAALGEFHPVSSRNEGTAGPADNFQFPGAPGVLGFITAISSGHDFCGKCNRMRLAADGWLRPCLFSDVGVDLLEPLRRGADDAELDALFDEALEVKPKDHELEERPEEKMLRSMVSIGG